MSAPSDLFVKNRMLKGLPLSERQLLASSCERVEIHLGDVIDEVGRPIQFLFFPINSALSIINSPDQTHTVEVMVTGNKGCSGASIVLGNDRSPCEVSTQISGVAIRLAASVFATHRSSLPYLEGALTRHNLLIMNLAVVSVGCSQFHSPAQRLARWLKTHWQRTGIDSFPFPSEFLSAQVGVASEIVKDLFTHFESLGLVQQGRNTVAITNQTGLEQRSCHCYTKAKASTEDYLQCLADLTARHRISPETA
ncbi:MAG: Crp/Fnr family transcriptional regulator [Nitrospira sp.]